MIIKPVSVLASGAAPDNGFDDTFDGSGAMKARWTQFIDPTVPQDDGEFPTQTDGRYRRLVVHDYADDRQLWFNAQQGQLYYQTLTFPFEVHALNIGIGLTTNSQTAPVPDVDMAAQPYAFCGVVVHVTTLTTMSYRANLVGHRGPSAYTIECKNTNAGSSNVIDEGNGFLGTTTRADLRVVGNADNTCTFYYREVGDSTWIATSVPPSQNPEPFGATVHVGLVAYDFLYPGVDFVGTCDEWIVVSNGV